VPRDACDASAADRRFRRSGQNIDGRRRESRPSQSAHESESLSGVCSAASARRAAHRQRWRRFHARHEQCEVPGNDLPSTEFTAGRRRNILLQGPYRGASGRVTARCKNLASAAATCVRMVPAPDYNRGMSCRSGIDQLASIKSRLRRPTNAVVVRPGGCRGASRILNVSMFPLCCTQKRRAVASAGAKAPTIASHINC